MAADGTIALDWWWVAIPLFVAELHNAFGLVLYTIALWDVDAANLPGCGDDPSTRARRRADPDVQRATGRPAADDLSGGRPQAEARDVGPG